MRDSNVPFIAGIVALVGLIAFGVAEQESQTPVATASGAIIAPPPESGAQQTSAPHVRIRQTYQPLNYEASVGATDQTLPQSDVAVSALEQPAGATTSTQTGNQTGNPGTNQAAPRANYPNRLSSGQPNFDETPLTFDVTEPDYGYPEPNYGYPRPLIRLEQAEEDFMNSPAMMPVWYAAAQNGYTDENPYALNFDQSTGQFVPAAPMSETNDGSGG